MTSIWKMIGIRRLAGLALVVAALLLLLMMGCGQAQKSPAAADNGDTGSTTGKWTPSVKCGTCHSAEAKSAADGQMLMLKHAEVGCSSCHADEQALSKVHENADGATTPTKLKKTTVEIAACESCHDRSGLVEKTQATTVLTDSKGTVVNPHALPTGDGHVDIVCGDCHSMHTAATAVQSAPELCKSCHHAGVFECKTCH